MRFTLIGADIVKIVRQNQREANLWCKSKELLIEQPLLREPVILHLEVEAVLAKDLAVPTGEVAGMLNIVHLECTGDLAVQAARKADETF